MAAAMDPVSAIAMAVGDVAGSVGNIVSSGNNLKAAKAQAAAQKYMAGQMTEQEYIKYMASLDNNLSDTVNNILSSKQKTDYLPMVIIGGIFLVVVVIASRKNITV
jgi:hypothetical protein